MQVESSRDFTLSKLIGSFEDPHDLYSSLRSRDRIYYDSISQTWLVTGHAAIAELLNDRRFSSELEFGQKTTRTDGPTFLETAIYKQIIFTDGEVHRQVQQIVLNILAQMSKELPSNVDAFARRLLEDIHSRIASDGQSAFDLIDDFCYPFSLLVISQLLGLSTDDLGALRKLARWSDTHGALTSGYLSVDMSDVDRLGDHFREMLSLKRQTPANDLMCRFIEEQQIFSDDDALIANCMMVFSAGRMTTRKLLGQGLPLLIPQWKKWRNACRSDPAITKRLTEELLRMVTPTRYVHRRATEDVDLSDKFPGNHLIRRDDKVMLFLEAGNRDPNCFPEPDSLDPDRRPNRHLAFGFGPHYCPGAKLARLEIQTALETFLESFADLQPDRSALPEWNRNPNLGGYTSYRVCPVLP